MYRAKVDVTLKKTVLDPQGQTVLQALRSLGFQEVESLRVGKHFEMTLKANERGDAERRVKSMCEKLLINPVIEEYSVQLDGT